MALSACNTLTDLHQRELAEHGSLAFPIACYHDDLPRQAVPWHWHEEWEFAIVTEGNAEFFVDNTRLLLTKGEGIFINSQALHAVQPSGSPGRLHSAVFHPRLVGGSADSFFHQTLVLPLLKAGSPGHFRLQPQVPWQARALSDFHQVWNALVQEPEDYENLIRYHLCRAIGIILRNCSLPTRGLSLQEQTDAARIRTMLEFIQAHFREDLTVGDIAARVNISGSGCLRCFHQMLGTTPMQYVKQLRLEAAADQLKSTAYTARQIALNCGFNDVSYFTRSFREKTGLTPAAYRKIHR